MTSEKTIATPPSPARHQLRLTALATPVVPKLDGVGVEQRAARTLAALAELGRVDVTLCRPLWADLARRSTGGASWGLRLDPLPGELVLRRAALRWPRSQWVAGIAETAHRLLPRADRLTVTLSRGMGLLQGLRAGTAPERTHFHAFRLAAAAALPTPRPRRCEIDLDDLESEVARAIAELARRLGDTAVASFYQALAERLVALEQRLLPRFDRAYVGSGADAAWLASRMPNLELRILPNVVDLPALTPAGREPGPTRFLFVGALAYYPNIDALRVLVDDVLPRLRSLRREQFTLHVVGRGCPPWLEARLRADPNVVFHGAVATMAPHFAAADALVVPLRAGGGTRIKLLEAFAQRVPVIATTIGAFGLDVADGRELVLADGADALAEACARFIDDPGHARPLTDAAFELVRLHHQARVFSECLQR